MCDRCGSLEAELQKVHGEAAAAKAVLAEIQWSGHTEGCDLQWCPSCPKDSAYGHAHDCRLNAALSGTAGADVQAVVEAAKQWARWVVATGGSQKPLESLVGKNLLRAVDSLNRRPTGVQSTNG